MSTPRCSLCYGEVFRPIVAYGRVFCERSCAYYFETNFPNIVAAYDHAFPRSARGTS